MGNYFASNLKFLRTQKGISQNKLAEYAHVNQTTINRWESKEMSPNIDNVNDVANALCVSVSDLLGKDLTSGNRFDKFDILYNKSKDILSDDDKQTIEFIMKKTIDNYEKNKNNN